MRLKKGHALGVMLILLFNRNGIPGTIELASFDDKLKPCYIGLGLIKKDLRWEDLFLAR
jgi:hypothetical protein